MENKKKQVLKETPGGRALGGSLSYESPSPLLDWNYLRAFYYVAQAQSFTKASQCLCVSQSSLSREIQNLEKRLNAVLFVRTPKKLILTRAGEVVFKAVSRTYQQIEFIHHKIEEDQNLSQGSIRIRADSGFISCYLLKHIPGFLKIYPDIRLSFASGKTVPEMDLLETDVIIRPFLPEREDLVQIPLLVTHVKLYASMDYLKQFGTPQNPPDLDHHRLIAFGNPPGVRGFEAMNWHLTLGLTRGQQRKAFVEVDLPQDCLQLAAEGLGIATASAEHPDLKAYRLVEVLGHIQEPTLQYAYIYSKKLDALNRIKVLGAYFSDAFTRQHGAP